MINNIIHGSNHSRPGVRKLVSALHREESLTGQLVTGYPLFPIEGRRPFSPDAVLVSEQGQVTVIDIAPHDGLGDYKDRQDLAYNQFRSRLFCGPGFARGRQLQIHLQTVTYAPGLGKGKTRPREEETPVVNDNQLLTSLRRFQQIQPKRYQDAGLDDDRVMAVLCGYRHDWGQD